MRRIKDRIRSIEAVQPLLNLRRARLLARNRQVETMAAHFAHLLHRANITLKDRVCLEIGSGWVLSHAIVMYLLGAKRVIATDIIRGAYPSVLKQAFDADLLRRPALEDRKHRLSVSFYFFTTRCSTPR